MATWFGEVLGVIKHSARATKPLAQRAHFESSKQMRLAPYQALNDWNEVSEVMTEDEFREVIAASATEAEIPFTMPAKKAKK